MFSIFAFFLLLACPFHIRSRPTNTPTPALRLCFCHLYIGVQSNKHRSISVYVHFLMCFCYLSWIFFLVRLFICFVPACQYPFCISEKTKKVIITRQVIYEHIIQTARICDGPSCFLFVWYLVHPCCASTQLFLLLLLLCF